MPDKSENKNKNNFKLTKEHIAVLIKSQHIELLRHICDTEKWNFEEVIKKYKNNIKTLSYKNN
tara:strand:+ start:176 stop:364 length:189 start_codon:yes stop_codon:yes gene_type:complete